MIRQINYDEVSKIYDDVRQADIALIRQFLQEIETPQLTSVLDLGCGTGNYADLFQKMSGAKVFGVEPSPGMLEIARQKSETVTFKYGDAEHILFDDDHFDFAYLIDVIHHVPNLDGMFAELKRVLNSEGKLCVVTQSHLQIENRPIALFFPATVQADKQRYPTVAEIIDRADQHHLRCFKIDTLFGGDPIELDDKFLELVQKKGYSMLHLISDQAYDTGLQALEARLSQGEISARTSGQTLLWFSSVV